MCLPRVPTSPPGTKGYCLVLSLLFLAALRVAGEESPLALGIVGPERIEVRGRQTVPLVLSVENRGATFALLRLECLLPAGWRSLAPEPPFALEPGASDYRTVGLLVPAEALAGGYSVLFRLLEVGKPSAYATATLHLTVLPALALELRPLSSPRFVFAGESFEARFLLRNRGNTIVHFDLAAQSSPPFRADLVGGEQVARTGLFPGSQWLAVVVVHTDQRLREAVESSVIVRAQIREPPGGRAVVATCAVEVLPVGISAAPEPARTIRAVSTTTATAGYAPLPYGTLQEEVTVRGALDEAGRHKLELDLRKRLSLDESALFDPNDRYRLSYRTPAAAVVLGDADYALSPLLAADAQGRGLQTEVRLGPVGASALYYEEIWSPGSRRGLGGRLDLTVPRAGAGEAHPLYRVGLSVLDDCDGRLGYGAWQQFSPSDALTLGVDAALQTDETGRPRPALYALAEGDTGALFYRGQYVRAWPGFRTRYRDSQSILMSGGVRLLRQSLKLYGSYSLWDGNLALDPALPAMSYRNLLVGIGAKIPRLSSEVGLEAEDSRQNDRRPSFDQTQQRDALRLRWWQPIGIATVGLSSQLGWTRSSIDAEVAREQSHRVSLDLRPLSDLVGSLAVDYRGRRADGPVARRDVGWEIGFQRFWRSLSLAGWARNRYLLCSSEVEAISGEVGSRLTMGLRGGQQLSVSGQIGFRTEGRGWEPGGELQVALSAPLDIPVSRKRAAALVAGRVTLVESGKPLQGIIVRLDGRATATDRRGEFLFRLPRVGRYSLSVDPARTNPDWITAQPMPIEVEATAQTKPIEIGIVRAASLHGRVAVYGFADRGDAFAGKGEPRTSPSAGPPRVREGGLANIVVELSSGAERMRSLTDSEGNFSFDGIGPGVYGVAVDPLQLPPGHRLDPPSMRIDLAPGETRSVEIRAVEEQRRIRTIDPGSAIELVLPPLTSRETGGTASAGGR